MKEIIKSNVPFLLPTFLFWLLLFVAVYCFDKADLHLQINAFHSMFFDKFFKLYTEVGGWFPFVVAVGLLFYRFGAAVLIVASQLAATIPVQVLKRTIDADRPKLFFEKIAVDLPQVEGVDLHNTHSFPSGHTAAAFALFFCLSVLASRPLYKILFFILSLLVAFSRVYLSQHFTLDVVVGSIIGVLASMLYYYYHKKMNVSWFKKSLLSKNAKL